MNSLWNGYVGRSVGIGKNFSHSVPFQRKANWKWQSYFTWKCSQAPLVCLCQLFLDWKSILVIDTKSAVLAQMLQNATSDQGLKCLLTRIRVQDTCTIRVVVSTRNRVKGEMAWSKWWWTSPLVTRESTLSPANLWNKISIFHGCMVWIDKSVTRVTDRHHEACLVMPNSDPEWQIFLSTHYTHDRYFFLHTF